MILHFFFAQREFFSDPIVRDFFRRSFPEQYSPKRFPALFRVEQVDFRPMKIYNERLPLSSNSRLANFGLAIIIYYLKRLLFRFSSTVCVLMKVATNLFFPSSFLFRSSFVWNYDFAFAKGGVFIIFWFAKVYARVDVLFRWLVASGKGRWPRVYRSRRRTRFVDISWCVLWVPRVWYFSIALFTFLHSMVNEFPEQMKNTNFAYASIIRTDYTKL